MACYTNLLHMPNLKRPLIKKYIATLIKYMIPNSCMMSFFFLYSISQCF